MLTKIQYYTTKKFITLLLHTLKEIVFNSYLDSSKPFKFKFVKILFNYTQTFVVKKIKLIHFKVQLTLIKLNH